MVRRFVKFMFVLTLTLLAAGSAAAAQKVIQDPAEYSAYMSALALQDPAQKGAAMEAFSARYPASVVKIEALEQAMAAYQQLGNQSKVERLANDILQREPGNVRALAISTYLLRFAAAKGDREAVQKVRAYGEKGLAAVPGWPRPEGVTVEEFTQLRDKMTTIFAGAAGFGALQAKDYAAARDYYLQAVALDPSGMQDIYQLAIAELEMAPPVVSGFWYVARAAHLAQVQKNIAGAQAIEKYGKARYRKYHGGEEGWDRVAASAAQLSAPPPGFAVKPALTPCELAVQAVADNDPATLSVSDWEFVLAHRDCSADAGIAAQKVWRTIQEKQQGARLQLPVKVIDADTTRIRAALSDENRQNNTADVEITLDKPMPKPPEAGAEITATGQITGYTAVPFLFKMSRGAVR